MRFRLASIVALFLGAATLTRAHPVAQGGMEISIENDRIDLRVLASNEEAFLAHALGSRTEPASNLEGVWAEHGSYLLQHIFLEIDGIAQSGSLISWSRPAKNTPEALTTYEFRYPLPNESTASGRIELRQNVLNEFNFVPGNRWEATYVVRVLRQGRVLAKESLSTSREPLILSASVTERESTARIFFRHGVGHILRGYDHLLFVAALVLAVRSLWDLIKVVTAFTIAHTITLVLAALNWVHVSSRLVEPVIGASIVFVAVQNVIAPSRTQGRARLAVAFGFGLFHGLGFAGGLLEIMRAMPGVALLAAVASFSIGVEVAHQMVALPLFAAVSWWNRQGDERSAAPLLLRIGSGLIALAGMYYLYLALAT